MESTLSVGAVIGDTAAILRRGGATLAALAALLLGLPELLPAAVAAAKPASPALAAGLAAAISIATVVFGVVFSAAATQASLDAAAGARPSFAASLRRGGRLSTGALFIDIRFGLGIVVASLLLAVPGVMLFCAWAVVLPAYVAERDGVRAAFARSRALTRGHRWRILGLLLVFAAATLTLAALIGAAAVVVPPAAANLLTGVLNAVLDAATLVGDAGLVALYAALRRIVDGAPSAALAEAFR